LRRATENLKVELADKTILEGGELRAYLMQLDELQQVWKKMDGACANLACGSAGNPTLAIDTRADFSEEKNLSRCLRR